RYRHTAFLPVGAGHGRANPAPDQRPPRLPQRARGEDFPPQRARDHYLHEPAHPLRPPAGTPVPHRRPRPARGAAASSGTRVMAARIGLVVVLDREASCVSGRPQPRDAVTALGDHSLAFVCGMVPAGVANAPEALFAAGAMLLLSVGTA